MCHGKGISASPRRRLWDDLPRVVPGDTHLPPNIFDPRKLSDPNPPGNDPDPRDRGRPNDPRNPGFPGDPRNPGRPNDPRVPGPPVVTTPDPRNGGGTTDPRNGGTTPNPPITIALDPRVHGNTTVEAAAPTAQMSLGPALKYLSQRSPSLAEALRPAV